MRFNITGRASAFSFAALVAALGCNAILGNDVGHLKASAQACTLNSDCGDGKLCIFATCSVPCKADVDCDIGSRCLVTSKGAACVVSSSADCASDRDCPEGSECNNGACRTSCGVATLECAKDQSCSGENVCVGSDPGHDPGATPGDGGGGGASGVGGASGKGGGTSVGGASGGKGGSLNSGGGLSGAGGGTASGGTAGSGGAPNTGGATGSGGVTATGGVSGTGGASGTGVKTLTTTTFDVQPGQEVFECQNFSNPFGSDVAVVQTDSTMPAIAHQMLAFYGTSFTAGPQAACATGLESSPFIHDAQTPADTMRYPPDVGRRLLATEGLRIWTHYINATTGVVSAQTSITLHAIPLASVHTLADGMFLYNPYLSLPPQLVSTASRDYMLPYGVNFLRAVGLMYKHGTRMKGTAGGQVLYDQVNWSGPTPALFSTPLAVASGTIVSWSCTYQNTTPSTITFGSAVSTNERCEMYGVFYATLPANQGTFISSSGP